jgi:hypothetical protein
MVNCNGWTATLYPGTHMLVDIHCLRRRLALEPRSISRRFFSHLTGAQTKLEDVKNDHVVSFTAKSFS